MLREFQKSKVYKWETKHVPKGPMVNRDHAQAIVDYVWSSEGRENPPTVLPIDTRNTSHAGKANRLYIWLQPMVSTKTILHEIAHSMTGECDGNFEISGHGPEFVGVVIRLYSAYLRVPTPLLMYTAKMSGVKFDWFANPKGDG